MIRWALILEVPMEAMRGLGSFGDERLKKGALICSRRWSISVRRAFGGWLADAANRYGLAASCTILRSRQRK